MIALPLEIIVKGEVVASNVSAFREMVRTGLKGINVSLKTDEDFGQAEVDSKSLKTAEETVRSAKEKALGDAEQLHALFTELDDTAEEIRKARLSLEGQIKKRKEEVKEELIEEGLSKIPVDADLAHRTFGISVRNAIKGKRTLGSMRKAVAQTVTVHTAEIKKSKAILDGFEKTHGTSMLMDRRELEVKRPDQVTAELHRRLDLKKAEEERTRLLAEAEKAKAEVAEMKQKNTEASKPPLPPQQQVKKPTKVETSLPNTGYPPEAAEWAAFRAACLEAFRPLKAAREALQNPQNIAKGQRFANALNDAWKEASK